MTKPQISETSKTTNKKKHQKRAISEAPGEIPVKPNTAAMVAPAMNTQDHLGMKHLKSESERPAAINGRSAFFRCECNRNLRELKEQRKGHGEAWPKLVLLESRMALCCGDDSY